MSSKNKKIIFIVICIVLVLTVSICKVSLVGADSGFDSSFDSGSSSGSGSGGSLDIGFIIYLALEHPLLFLIVVTVIVITVILKNTASKKEEKVQIERGLNSKLELLDIEKYPEEKKLEIEAFNLYKQIQFAWMNFDKELLRQCTTDEMYNMYLMQMETLKVKNEKNLIYDINYIESNIISNTKENGVDTIKIGLRVTCYDFIINEKTQQAVRGRLVLNEYIYELTFVKTNEKIDIKQCPRCGAPVEANNSGMCEYCKSTLVSNEYSLILSKKKMLIQR